MAGIHQGAAEGGHDVGFAGAGPTYQTDIGGTGDELAAHKLSDLCA